MIVELHFAERAESDMWRLLGLGARDAIWTERLEPELEMVATDLSRVERAWRTGDAVLGAAAADLAGRTAALGLNRISRVARSVELLACGADKIALDACTARLSRLGNATLREIWRMEDANG